VACNDDRISNSDVTSYLQTQLTAGQTYYIEIAGYYSYSSGAMQLHLVYDENAPINTPTPTFTPQPTNTPTPTLVPPNNDDVDNSTTVNNLPYSNTQSTNGATVANDDPIPTCAGRRYNTVWYKYTTSSASTLKIDTYGSNFDSILSVYTGVRGAWTQLGCNDDNNGTLQSGLQINTNAGQTYYIMVSSYRTGGGSLKFNTKVITLAATTLKSPINGATISTWQPPFIWNAVPESTSYSLQVRNASNILIIDSQYTASEANCADGITPCSKISPRTLTRGTYTWKIRTMNSDIQGPWSNVGSFKIPDPPGKATLVSPITGTAPSSRPTYRWNSVPYATHYYLQVSGPSGLTRQWYTSAQANCANGAKQCYITPSNTLKVGRYTWWIMTWNPSGYGPWSNPATFNAPGLPATLISPNAQQLVPTKPTFIWQSVTGATKYYLKVSSSRGVVLAGWYTTPKAICNATTKRCSVTSPIILSKGTYQWWIQSWDQNGYGQWSNSMTFIRR
jgi:hypothetical protein